MMNHIHDNQSNAPMQILYQDDAILVVQTHAGAFDKTNLDDLYGAFNLGLHVNDNPQQVLANRAKLLSAIQAITPADAIYWLNQVHGDVVHDVDDATLGLVADAADALMTNRSGVGLSIMTADCVPIAMFDRQGGGIACIHAGWQGLTNGIIAKTVQRLHTNRSSLSAVIGACISREAYEIDRALADKICQTVVSSSLVAMDYHSLFDTIIMPSGDDKVHIDLTTLTKLQLAHQGVNIVDTPILCSYQTASLYSYRAQTHAGKSATGRMAMTIIKK